MRETYDDWAVNNGIEAVPTIEEVGTRVAQTARPLAAIHGMKAAIANTMVRPFVADFSDDPFGDEETGQDGDRVINC